MNNGESSSTPADAAPGTIFAVDDDENDRRLFASALSAAGLRHSCRFFSCGDELLDALLDVLRGATPPVLCFVDVKMAGMSGLDVLRWIRAQHALREIPVVMLSSSEAPDHLAEALHFGAQCYTAKFPEPAQLRQIVTTAEQFVAASAASFLLPCNLLLAAHQAVA